MSEAYLVMQLVATICSHVALWWAEKQQLRKENRMDGKIISRAGQPPAVKDQNSYIWNGLLESREQDIRGWKNSKTLLNYRYHVGKKSREKKLKKPLNRAAIKYICSTCLSFLSLKASSCIKLICCRAEIIDLRARTTSSWWMSANEWWPKVCNFQQVVTFSQLKVSWVRNVFFCLHFPPKNKQKQDDK